MRRRCKQTEINRFCKRLAGNFTVMTVPCRSEQVESILPINSTSAMRATVLRNLYASALT